MGVIGILKILFMKVSFFAYKAMYPKLFKGRCSMKSVKFTVSGGAIP